MSLKKYEVFVTTVSCGSLTRAAELLGSTQSRVSHALAALEAELGFALLHRSRSGVALTEAGAMVLPHMQAILAENKRLTELAADIRSADAGTVRLGAFTSVAVHWLPGIIQDFQAAHPRVKLELLSGDYYDMEQWLRKGSVDLGFVTLPAPEGMETVTLCQDELLAVLPPDHPLAAWEAIPIAELADAPFISLPQSSAHDIHRALDKAGVHPQIKLTTRDDYAIIAMVEQGLGVSIMPELLLRGRSQGVALRPLLPRAERTIALARPSQTALPAVDAFTECAVAWVQAHPPRRNEDGATNPSEENQP